MLRLRIVCILLSGIFCNVFAAEPLLFDYFGTVVPEEALNYPIPQGLTAKPADEDNPRWVINRKLPDEAKRFESLGYVPYITNYMDLVFQESVPRAEQLVGSIQLQATPGELETGAFAIYALKDINDVKISVGPLQIAGGSTLIPVRNIEIRSAFYMRRLCWQQPRFIVHPTILEKKKSINIPAKNSQLYYITVQVPQNTPAGRYISDVQISGKNADKFNMTLELEVLPFVLLTSDRLYAFWYHDDTPKELLVKDFSVMRFAGMNSIMTALTEYACGVKITGQGQQTAFDFIAFEDFMSEYVRAGYTKPLNYNLVLKQILDLDDEALAQLIIQMNALSLKNNWPGFIWGMGDECDATEASLAKAKALVARVNKIVPNDLTKMTIVFPENWNVYGSDIDILVWAGYFDGTLAEKTRKLGCTLGAYNGTGAYEVDPRDNRYFYGLWTWKAGLEQVEQWVYNECLYNKDQPFNDLSLGALSAGRGNCHYYCYPAKDGPLPTVGYYGIMEGVDDAKYLYTLEQTVQEAQKKDDKQIQNLVVQSLSFLEMWKSRIDLSPLPDRNKSPHFTINREVNKLSFAEYDCIRKTCSDLIIRLKAQMQR